MRCVFELESLPYTQLFTLDEARAHHSAIVAVDSRLSGADAVYVSLAGHLAMALVSWDRRQRERAQASVVVTTPADLLAGASP
jgi:hypothetical protein